MSKGFQPAKVSTCQLGDGRVSGFLGVDTPLLTREEQHQAHVSADMTQQKTICGVALALFVAFVLMRSGDIEAAGIEAVKGKLAEVWTSGEAATP